MHKIIQVRDSDMIFSPRDAVSRIASELRLYPGDIIACGTSVGTCFMQPGQQIEIRIPGLGSLVNRYTGEAVSGRA